MEYPIPRICDNYLFQNFIIDVFLDKSILFASELSFAKIKIAGQEIEIPPNTNIESHYKYKIIQKIQASAGFSIENIKIGYTTQPSHPHNQKSTVVEYSRSTNNLIDKIKITDGHTNDDNLIAFIEIRQQLDKISYYGNNQDSPPPVSDVLSRLEGLAASLITDAHKQHIISSKENEEYRVEQEIKYLEKTDNRLNELEEIYKEKNDDLIKREEKLIDADNTTARRQVRNDLIASVTPKAEKFSFSSSVNNNIKIIGTICIILAFFGLIVSITSYSAIISGKTDNETTLWFHYVKSFSGGAVFLTSLTYLIRWLNQWTNRVANTELDYQQFERDLNRSHLAIEMCLEWKDKKDEPVPEKLLQAMTNGLFITKDDSHKYDEVHPVDQIAAALIKSADKLEIPIGTAIATTSGKNLKKEKINTN